MPWFMPQVSESVKNRVCIYLLQRYFGHFIEQKLTLDQLSIDLYNGTGTVKNISLDVQALNELGEKQNWPMEFVDGSLEELSASVPWASLLKNSSFVEVRGLKLTVQPKQRHECATSMFESMWSSMTSSMQLAEECVKQDPANSAETAQPFEVIERFAQTIDSILSRVKVKFVDITIQVEHVPKDSSTGVALLIHIPIMEYLDEAGNDPPAGEAHDLSGQDQNKAFVVSSFTTKKFYMEGITFSTVEFPSKARTFSRSVMSQSNASEETVEMEKVNESVFYPSMGENEPKTLMAEEQMEEAEVGTAKVSATVLKDQRHVVQFGRLVGRQEIIIRMKQSENINGPKVSIANNLGSFILFLSPRQVHVLVELANGLASPDMEDTSNVAPRQKCVEKPMTELDYQRIEQELQQQLHPLSTFQPPGLQGAHGWSTAALEESDSDDNFLPMTNTPNTSGGVGTSSSSISVCSSSPDSSVTSSMISSVTDNTSRSRRKVTSIDSDPTAEISHFEIRVASFAMVLLHEDILALSIAREETLLASSVQQMQNTSQEFFNKLGFFSISGNGNKDFENTRRIFEEACKLNHLRLLAAPLQLEAKETTTLSAFSVSGKLTVAKLEVLEYISNDERRSSFECIRLLNFNDDIQSNLIASKPSLKLAFKHVERTGKTSPSRHTPVPKTDISFTLGPCNAEIDISIVDRLCALLYPEPVCVIKKRAHNVWGSPSTNAATVQSGAQLDLKIGASVLNIKLRFPIPDFRHPTNMQRNPWWQRSVRKDFFVLKLQDMCATTSFATGALCEKYVLQCQGLDVFYAEDDNVPLIPIAKVGTDEKYTTSLPDSVSLPLFTLLVYPEVKPDMELEELIAEEKIDPMTQSVYGSLGQDAPTVSGPFSAKRVVHQSDTPHSKTQQDDPEELVMPGDSQEINDFTEQTMQSSRFVLNLCLPSISMQLASKHIYEVVYNRINNDLLLWEPSAPKAKSSGITEWNDDNFSICYRPNRRDSGSDSAEDDDELPPTIFYSFSNRHPKPVAKGVDVNAAKRQTYLSVFVQIGHGLLATRTPVRDLSSNVIPGQHGEIVLSVQDAKIFSATAYQEDPDLGFVSVQVHNAKLHHCDMVSTPSQNPPLKEVDAVISQHLHPTVYKSDQGMLINSYDHGAVREMLSVAVRIQANHETHHVKTVRVAVGINKATLRYRMCPEPNSWVSHLMDFFNVADYPIPGYNSKDVLTELHLHLWDCSIDYRPFYLPFRSAVTVGNFSMSSHLSAQANTSTLRFIAEECALLLSDKSPSKGGIPSTVPVDLKRDYVSVVDIGLFELSLRTTDRKVGINPHIDLRASNNILHMRTCADSGRALMQLITYFASDGDILPQEEFSSSSSDYSSPRHTADEELICVEQQQDVSNLSKSQHQQVSDMLGEAMKESSSEGDESADVHSSEAKLFFFPDEGHPSYDGMKPLPQVTRELGDITVPSNKSSDTDEDFCIVGDDEASGILPKSASPEIKWLTDEPLRILENHFSVPLGKTDMLKAPRDYPVPETRYTLCEMTLVWHMYGGNDFHSESEPKPKKSVNFVDAVGYTNTGTGEVIFSNLEEMKPNLEWKVRGGKNRNHDVLMELQLNKVRFQHEVYPGHCDKASRQVLIVSEFEIRDRLASSQINKFLYQYTSQARPKQSHAHMIVIKALHIRPDPALKREECCLKVSLLPLRLNIDQDSLLFLISFFNELSGNATKPDTKTPTPPSRHSTPTHQPPIMTVNLESEEEVNEKAQQLVDDNLMLLLEENKDLEGDLNTTKSSSTSSEGVPPVYFRSLLFSPAVPIRLDYHGKRLDMTHGPLAGLLMGLGQLNCSELHLKRLANKHGVLGLDKLLQYCLHEWLKDIKSQLPGLLGGVGPMHSLVQLFQGIKDLFWMPIEQYQKDGRIVRGLQRGANSFTTSTAMAALELTTRIIHLIQITAETAFDMVSPGPSVKRRTRVKGRKKKSYNQPQDIRKGVAIAYDVVKEGIGETADNIMQVASHEFEQKGYSGAVGGVLRQIPPTVVKPIIIASEATSNVLGGMHSQLVPDARQEANQKWRNDGDG